MSARRRALAPWSCVAALLASCGGLRFDCEREVNCPASECVPMADRPFAGEDTVEPGGDLVLATPPSANGECAGTRTGTIDGYSDADVFRTSRCDVSGDPLAILDGDKTLRLCMFVVCQHGSTNVYGCYEDSTDGADTCGDGSDPDIWPVTTDADFPTGGFPGCCRQGPGRLRVQVECGGYRLQRIEGYTWVDSPKEQAGHTAQLPYTVTYDVRGD